MKQPKQKQQKLKVYLFDHMVRNKISQNGKMGAISTGNQVVIFNRIS